MRALPVSLPERTSSGSPSPTSTDCSIHDGAATAPAVAMLPLPDNLGSRAARPLWSERGGRGGVIDLGGGGQPTAEASAASTSGSPSARTRNVALCARRPRDARCNKKGLKDTLGLTPERVSGVPLRGL